MVDAYSSMIALLASGGRLPRDYVDRTTTAAGHTAGDLARDLLKAIGVPLRCQCGRRPVITSVHHSAGGGTTRYTRCPSCGERGKVVARS